MLRFNCVAPCPAQRSTRISLSALWSATVAQEPHLNLLCYRPKPNMANRYALSALPGQHPHRRIARKVERAVYPVVSFLRAASSVPKSPSETWPKRVHGYYFHSSRRIKKNGYKRRLPSETMGRRVYATSVSIGSSVPFPTTLLDLKNVPLTDLETIGPHVNAENSVRHQLRKMPLLLPSLAATTDGELQARAGFGATNAQLRLLSRAPVTSPRCRQSLLDLELVGFTWTLGNFASTWSSTCSVFKRFSCAPRPLPA